MKNIVWSAPLALLLLVGCGDAGGEAGAEMGTENGQQMAAGEQTTLSVPACQPSDRMPLPGRPSPYDSTTIQVGEGVAKICYGRPSLKGRTMIGGEAVPYDTLWRTGANEPTTVHLNVPARIAGMEVEPGAYSLYTVPREEGPWTLIVNSSTSQWGHEASYTEEVRAQEVGRAEVPAERVEQPTEQLTIRPAGEGQQGAVLEWQNSRVRIPIEPAG